jgi:uncharacterized membrane protein
MGSLSYETTMLTVAQFFEVTAAVVILVGLFWSVFLALRVYRRSKSGSECYKIMRQAFGGAILLGLEILVAGDLIRTVAVEPTLDNVIVLGIIVLIRTFLSFSLEIEINGEVPWKRALVSGATVMNEARKQANPATPKDPGA